MDTTADWEIYHRKVIDLTFEAVERKLEQFSESLNDWLDDLLNHPIGSNWPDELARFVAHSAYYGLDIEPESIAQIAAVIQSRAANPDALAFARDARRAVNDPPPFVLPARPLIRRPPPPPPTRPEISATERGQIQRFARRCALGEQQRIALSDEEWAQYEYYLYQNFLRQRRGEPPLPQLQCWIDRSKAFKAKTGATRRRPKSEAVDAAKTDEENSSDLPRPIVLAAMPNVSGPRQRSDDPTPPKVVPIAKAPSGGQKGGRSQFANEAEEIVSEEAGVPRNLPGPRQQTIPGSGPGGFRILDFPHRGREGSIRLRGTVIEVKASAGTKFGDLSGRSRQQIKDAINYVWSLRSKASLVKNPAVKALLENAHVEVFSDLAKPKRGEFAELIRKDLLEWKPIPRPEVVTVQAGSHPVVPSSPRSIGKPGLGAAENIALGLVIAFVEADIANTLYRESATVLNDLLRQIAQNDDADEADWRTINEKLKEIASMKQSILGYIWEVISYGQGSLLEKQAMAMMSLALDLGEKYGYKNTKTWGDIFGGGLGRFERK